MRVHVLSARTRKAYNIAYPLRAFRRELRRRGIRVRFFFDSDHSLVDCDVLCILSEYRKLQRIDRSGDSLLDRLRRYRDAVSSLIWLDTSDSTGTTSFEVLPYVDLYAKSQLLRDRSKYTGTFYGMRCYTDFYHNNYGIKDTRETWRVPARPEHLHKLAVSWNLGLGSYASRDANLVGPLRGLKLYWPFAKYEWKHAPADATRPVDIKFSGRLNYERETVTFQRGETYRRTVEFARRTGCRAAYSGRLPYREYREEMRRSKLVLSPFGFGEINVGRDFECFADGAALVKPDMNHLVTWPDYFEAGVTYAAYAWDFSDFEATLEALLANPVERLRIAQAGQARYLSSLSEEGKNAFVDHLQTLLEQAARNPTR